MGDVLLVELVLYQILAVQAQGSTRQSRARRIVTHQAKNKILQINVRILSKNQNWSNEYQETHYALASY